MLRSTVTALALTASTLQAEPHPLSAPEISALLTDQTAIGIWAGERYRQWFAADGSTIYAQFGARSSVGKWRVNAAEGTYESWWGGTEADWEGFKILKDGDTYFWAGEHNPPQPFTLVPGQQLVFEE